MSKFNLFTVIFILCYSFVLAQNKSNLENNLYEGVTINLTPTKPFESVKKSNELHNELIFYLIKHLKGENKTLKRGSIIINLTSGVSWELFNPPKNPPFFLIRLLINKKNRKVIERLEYLKFNSLCEQKPDSLYKLIESFDVYEYYTLHGDERLYKFKVEYNSLGKFNIIEKK